MLDIQVTGDSDNVTLLEASGRIDSMNANELGEALSDLISRGKVQLVLDLQNVDYMSSAGLREIVSALKQVKRVAGGDLRIAQPSDRVREVLEMAGLDTIFQIFETQADAINSF